MLGPMSLSRPLVLASTSRHRASLLQRAGLAFVTADPRLDEEPLKRSGVTPEQLVLGLAEAKARAVAGQHPHAWIVGSDQCAEIDGCVLGKPGAFNDNVEQLQRLSGRAHRLLTGLCLLDGRTGQARLHLDVHVLRMRQLARGRIEAYVSAEQPFDCAGGYKIEAAGITLFESIRGDDHTAIVGLPMMQLVTMLLEAGAIE